MVTLVDPANPPSRKAPMVWAIAAAIPWTLLSVAQLVWFALDVRFELHDLDWLHAVAAAGTALGIVTFVVVAPLWRYRVHRWDIFLDSAALDSESGRVTPAVYTRTGWLVQERRIAPISRVQTVDTHRGPLDRIFGLADVTVTTASSAGAVRIVALDSDVADRIVAQLTDVAALGDRDAT
jgi:membrane protein YdbS with pleckstrin-like domain